jgi:hypothetical protein
LWELRLYGICGYTSNVLYMFIFLWWSYITDTNAFFSMFDLLGGLPTVAGRLWGERYKYLTVVFTHGPRRSFISLDFLSVSSTFFLFPRLCFISSPKHSKTFLGECILFFPSVSHYVCPIQSTHRLIEILSIFPLLLQHAVNTLGAPAVTLIIEEHSDDDLRRLMIDPFGNYLFQKLVEGSDVSDFLPWLLA